jgi:hypothetical protein
VTSKATAAVSLEIGVLLEEALDGIAGALGIRGVRPADEFARIAVGQSPCASSVLASSLPASAPASPAAPLSHSTADGHAHVPLVHVQLVWMVVVVRSQATAGVIKSYAHWSLSLLHAAPGTTPALSGQLPLPPLHALTPVNVPSKATKRTPTTPRPTR